MKSSNTQLTKNIFFNKIN